MVSTLLQAPPCGLHLNLAQLSVMSMHVTVGISGHQQEGLSSAYEEASLLSS